MNSLAFELLILGLLTLFNGFLAMSEIAIISSRVELLKALSDQGNKRAASAVRLAESPTNFLSTVQVGITLASIVAGVIGGVSLAEEFGAGLSKIPSIGPYVEILSYGLIALSITVLTVVFGEIVPKRIALAYPETIATGVAPFIEKVSKLISPLVISLEWMSKKVLSLLPIKTDTRANVTEEEVRALIRQGAAQGVFEKEEEVIFNKALRFGEKTAAALMTPRGNVEWIDIASDWKKDLGEAYESGHSIFVVAEESLDNIVGIVTLNELSRLLASGGTDLRSIIREPLSIPGGLQAHRVLERFRAEKKTFALVLDEYGGFDGVLTLHDLVEAIFGELGEEGDEPPGIKKRRDGSLLVDAATDIEELLEHLGVDHLIEDERRGYHSLGGFVLSHLGHIPTAGEHFSFSGFTFEVVDMDRQRIDKVLIKKTH